MKLVVIPGLDKHVKDASADTLAIHGNLFGQINLYHIWTLGIDYIKCAAPHLGLTTTTSNGAANLPPAMHKHLSSYLTRNRAFPLDNRRQSYGFTRLQVMYDFLKEFFHLVVPIAK